MHILYFHQHFSTPEGSTGTRSYEMSKKLVVNGHKVTIVCGSYAGGHTGIQQPFNGGVRKGTVENIDIIEFDLAYSNSTGFAMRAWFFLLFALRAIHVALFTKADLIFATSTPLTAGIPGIVARWIKGMPFVFEVRDLWPELPREMKVITNPAILAMMSFLEWASYKSAHRLIGLSPGIVEGIKRHNISSDKIALIPNGCDLDVFDGSKNTWRPEGVNPDDLMAVFTGTHGRANGLDAVLDTARILQGQEHNNIKFVLIGQGKLKPELQKRAKKESLNNIIFLDPVSKVELAKLMAGADIGMQILANIPAFYYGTSPNKFFDYLSASLPIITNYPGWVADLITENKCGYAVPPETPELFARALCEARDNNDLKVMGANARKIAKSEFSRDKLSTKFSSWLEETVDQQ